MSRWPFPCFAALRSAEPFDFGEADEEWEEVRREGSVRSVDDVLNWENQPDKRVGRSPIRVEEEEE